jgi:OmpA-OmpF porin, OOP family
MSLRLKLLGAAAIGALTISTHAASAGDFDGWYVGAGGGWNALNGVGFTTSKPQDGWIADVRTGYKFPDSPFRLEGDLNYRNNDLNDHGGPLDGDGHVEVVNAMLDAIYDFETGGPVKPYLGLGFGWSRSKSKAVGQFIDFNTSPNELGAQLLAGLGWQFAPHWTADLEYRYYNNLSTHIDGTVNDAPSRVKETFDGNAVLAGLRWSWGTHEAPPPPPPLPPPPPPPPAPTPTVFKVYFPWNAYRLSGDAKNVVDEIANQYKGKNVSHVEIQGNTDTSGTPGYNMKLGSKRAEAVRAELVADGVPASIISTESLGESNPAVKTGNGVREPLNRRAEVVIKLEDRGS